MDQFNGNQHIKDIPISNSSLPPPCPVTDLDIDPVLLGHAPIHSFSGSQNAMPPGLPEIFKYSVVLKNRDLLC